MASLDTRDNCKKQHISRLKNQKIITEDRHVFWVQNRQICPHKVAFYVYSCLKKSHLSYRCDILYQCWSEQATSVDGNWNHTTSYIFFQAVIRYGLLVQYLQMKSAIVSWLVGVRSHRWLSLQIFIELNAVVSWVCHHHMTLRCDREALWSIQWICRCVDIWQERSVTVKNLKNVTNYMLYFLSNSHVVIHKIKI